MAMAYTRYKIEFPNPDCRMDQSEEWITVHSEGSNKKFVFMIMPDSMRCLAFMKKSSISA